MVVASRCREKLPSACFRHATLPSVDDLLHILQALRQTRSKEKIRKSFLAHLRYVHLSICELGLDGHSDLCNYLVPIFLDNGFFLEALQIFHKTPRRNEYAWTSLIESWYVDFVDVLGTFKMYENMKKDDVFPSKCTFLTLLRACCQSMFMMGGLFIHHEVVSNNIEEDSFLASSLVHMYGKCGLLFEAQTVFDKLHIRDVVTWTVLIVGYAEFGDAAKALCCVDDMIKDGVSPNAFTLVAILKACHSNFGSIFPTLKSCNHDNVLPISIFQGIHIEATKKSFEIHPFVGSALIDLYTKYCLLSEAQYVFSKVSDCDVALWNALMGGYVENHEGNEGLRCFEKMHMNGTSPDTTTFNIVLKACGNVKGGLEKGQEIYVEIVKGGFESDLFVGNSLIDMYIRHDLLEEALHIFTNLPVCDVVSWNAFMSWYVEHQLGEETLKCLRSMVADGVPPNEVTFFCALKACYIVGSLEGGQEIHSEILKKGCEDKCTAIHNRNSKTSLETSLIDMYAKCSMIGEAQWIFDASPHRHLVTWNAIMTGHTHQGNSETVFYLLERMMRESIQPDAITFLCILTICSFSGHAEYAYIFFEIMRGMYNLLPSLKHYGCIVDLLGRCGQLDDAIIVSQNMPFQPDLPLWSTMLGACHKWGNVEIASQAYNFAHTLDETHFGSFISIFNVYAIATISSDVYPDVYNTRNR